MSRVARDQRLGVKVNGLRPGRQNAPLRLLIGNQIANLISVTHTPNAARRYAGS